MMINLTMTMTMHTTHNNRRLLKNHLVVPDTGGPTYIKIVEGTGLKDLSKVIFENYFTLYKSVQYVGLNDRKNLVTREYKDY